MTKLNFIFQIDENKPLGDGYDWHPQLTIRIYENGDVIISATEEHTAHNSTPIEIYNGKILEFNDSFIVGSLVIADREKIKKFVKDNEYLLVDIYEGHFTKKKCSIEHPSDILDYKLSRLNWTKDQEVWQALDWVGPFDNPDFINIANNFSLDHLKNLWLDMAKNDNIVLVNVDKAIEDFNEYKKELESS
jgi:hypothetical protein